jgi:hypothetical protein
MQLRRRARARHRAEEAEEADLVIDLRERLAPYGRPEAGPDEHGEVADDTSASAPQPRRARPLRST